MEARKVWTKTWKLPIKAKLKHIIWKLYKGWISANSVLIRRGLNVEETCRRCGEGGESVHHKLFACDFAGLVWEMSPVKWDGLQHLTNQFSDWWDALMKIEKGEEVQARVELSVYILWQIWKARNVWLYEGKKLEPMEVVQRAMKEWGEFKQVQDHKKNTIGVERRSEGQQVEKHLIKDSVGSIVLQK
ncbi:OLC1v1031812C1 [Oldenlandia corymbosa var. corymbosa]|uniref:OLC1v1031812C1 n=1 Tax=Oldenlandia corymbosa var. corymbosa TaxID=529605 RepID=A0AAV1CK49_OLDCO|nr:OLC1v1031812C1 [Oldenlandia corymbosa var. corymbosa]